MNNKKKRNRIPGMPSKREMREIALVLAVVFNVNTGYAGGGDLTPGMSKVYWAPLNAITAQPEPTTTYGAAGATAATTGSWTFAVESGFTTNGFIDLKSDLLKGSKITWGNDGDLASPSQKTMLTGRIMGLNAEIVERVRDMAGVPGVFMVKTPSCSSTEYWVVGCACAAAFWKWKGDTDELGGTKGKGGDFEIVANCAPYKWSGTITLKAV